MKSLWKTTAEWAELMRQLEDNGGEVTPEIEEALTITEDNFLAKSESYIYTIKDYEAWENRIADEIARLQQMKKVATNAKNRLKQTLIIAMDTFGRDKVEVGLHTASLRTTKAVHILDENRVPNDYKRVEVSIDKRALLAALKQGEVEGAELDEGIYLHIR